MKEKIKNNTSKIVYGCMGGSGAFGPVEEQQSIEALQVAFDEGVTFFDTAEMYGNGYSEQLLAKALNKKRHEINIISKVSPENLSKEKLKKACERSLRNLKTDYIDIYLVHWPNREIPFEQYIGALKELENEGKILSYGVSNFGVEDLEKIYQIDNDICVDEVCYNLFTRAAEFELIPSCKEKDIPIFAYSSLMQGLLTGKYKKLDDFPDNRARMHLFDSRKRLQSRHGGNGQEDIGQNALNQLFKISYETNISFTNLAIGWLKSKSIVSGVIVGTKNAEQSHNLSKFINLKLESDVIKKLDDATLDLKNALKNNIDPWDFRTR